MKIKAFILCMVISAHAGAATVSGSIAYSFKGMSGVVPFSVNEGEDISIADSFKETPYVYSMKDGEKTNSVVREGAGFKLHIKPLSNNQIKAHYSLKLERINKIEKVGTAPNEIEIPDISMVFNDGSVIFERGERRSIFNSENASVSIVVY